LPVTASRRTGKHFFALVAILVISLQFVVPVGFSTATTSSRFPTSLTEWTVPTPSGGPWALTLDQEGRCCWFLEYYGNRVGHLDPLTGTFQEWAIPTSNAYPYDLAISTVSGSVVLWGTEFGADNVFAFWPATGVFREYPLPCCNSGVGYISVEPPTAGQVRVWFTETTRNRNGEFIFDPTTSNVTLYEDQFPAAVGGGAYGVYAGSNSVWFAGFSALVKWDRPTQQYTVWPLPVHGSALGRFIALGSNGDVWYTQGSENATSDSNYVGVLRAGSTIEEWRLPSLGADPRSISLNPFTQQPWIAEQSSSAGNGSVAALNNPTGGTVVPSSTTTVPSGGSPVVLGAQPSSVTVSTHIVIPVTTPIPASSNGALSEFALGPTQPRDCVVDSEGNVWVSEPGANKIGRLSGFGPDYALSASPSLLSLSQGSSATVTITGASISGFAGTVGLTATGLPLGVTVSGFNPSSLSIPPGGNDSANVLVNVAVNAVNGTSVILFHGNNGTIDRITSIVLIVTSGPTSPNSSPRCLIATATYGSEVAPEVQLLRNFRDYAIMRTRSGSNFMVVFNAWYYSFSPYVANYLSNHWVERTIMKGVLYPLVGILYLTSELFSATSGNPEIAVLLSGLFASSLIGALYLGLPLSLIRTKMGRRGRTKALRKLISVILLGGLAALFLGEVFTSPLILTLSSSTIILSTLFLAGLETSGMIARTLRPEP